LPLGPDGGFRQAQVHPITISQNQAPSTKLPTHQPPTWVFFASESNFLAKYRPVISNVANRGCFTRRRSQVRVLSRPPPLVTIWGSGSTPDAVHQRWGDRKPATTGRPASINRATTCGETHLAPTELIASRTAAWNEFFVESSAEPQQPSSSQEAKSSPVRV
jgi:hypothetical protein